MDTAPGAPFGNSHFGVARLTAGGALDPSLSTPQRTATEIAPSVFARLADGSTFFSFDPEAPRRVAPSIPFGFGRLLPDGSLDGSFSLGPTAPAGFLSPLFISFGFEPTADGNFFTWGKTEDDAFWYGAVREDGTKNDLTVFDAGAPSFRQVDALPDGRLLMSAGTDPQATLDGPAFRMKRSGRLDQTFQLDAAVRSGQVVRNASLFPKQLALGNRLLAIQPDLKLIFEYLATDQLFHLVRLHADGSRDDSFSETTVEPINLTMTYPGVFDRNFGFVIPTDGALMADLPILGASVQDDGRIVIVGQFKIFRGVKAGGIVRLKPDGTVDSTFVPGSGAQWTETTEAPAFFPKIEAIARQNDGKLLLAGTFEAFNGASAPGVVSLNPDGSLDTAFSPPAVRRKFALLRTTLGRQPDGSFLLAGAYSIPTENDPTFIRIRSLGGVPIVGSAGLATALVGESFRYQIVASGQPASYGAAGLPSGFSLNPLTGLVTGTGSSSEAGTYEINLTATNAEGTSAPKLLTLTIPGPIQLLSAVSRKYHSTETPFFDIPLPQSGNPGVECRRILNGGSHTLVLTFATEVARVGSVSVTAGTGRVSTSAPSAEDQHEFVITLLDVADAQVIAVTLNDVTDTFGVRTPSVTVRMAVLVGDVNGSGSVGASDIAQTKALVGQSITASNFRADVNLSGAINGSDISLVKANSGAVVPAEAQEKRAGFGK